MGEVSPQLAQVGHRTILTTPHCGYGSWAPAQVTEARPSDSPRRQPAQRPLPVLGGRLDACGSPAGAPPRGPSLHASNPSVACAPAMPSPTRGLCCSGCAGTDPTSTTPGPRPGPGTGPGSWTGRPRPDHLRRIDTGAVTDCPVRRPCPGPGAERVGIPPGSSRPPPPGRAAAPPAAGPTTPSASRQAECRRGAPGVGGTPDDTAHPTTRHTPQRLRAVDPLSRPPPHATPPHERARRRGRPRCRYELPSRWRRNSASMKASRSPSRTASTLPVS